MLSKFETLLYSLKNIKWCLHNDGISVLKVKSTGKTYIYKNMCNILRSEIKQFRYDKNIRLHRYCFTN